MAYEAMNNAGALGFPPDRHPQRQRHVDRPAGGRDERLPVAADVRPRLPPVARDRRRQLAERLPRAHPRARGTGRGIRPRHDHRRHAVRGARLLLRRPDRRPQPRPPAAGAEERARRRPTRARSWSTSSPRRARATPRPRPRPTSITAWSSSTWSPASRSRRKAGPPTYTKVFAEALIEEAEQDDEDRRDHRRDAVRHRPRPVRQGLPASAPSTSASPSSTR